jgi:ParB-like chromosome segregation protein Spo0J
MKKPVSNIQLPLITENPGRLVDLKLKDITSLEFLDSPEPDTFLIESVASYWIPVIIVCPDNRFPEKFYPIDGKRRVKAAYRLNNMGYKFNGIPLEEMPIRAVLRDDLRPEDAAAFRLAFKANNTRSTNLLTDIDAVKAAAKELKIDLYSERSASEIAKNLGAPVAKIKRMIEATKVNPVVSEALQSGLISPAAAIAIGKVRSPKAKETIYQRLNNGEFLSTTEILEYNKSSKNIDSAAFANNISSGSDLNPLQDAIKELKDILDGSFEQDKIVSVITKVINLLEELL